jgi:NADH-quinone oxidoreductase subunit B
VVNWSRENSLWPMPFGTACCAIEMMATAASRYDLARFGMERMSFSPRQADLLICAGRVSYKMAPVLRRIWEQMPQPKWSISMGACASSGGVFDVYSMVQGIDTIIPVDVYVPGCPPRPEGLMYGILMIQEKIRRSSRPRTSGWRRRTSGRGAADAAGGGGGPDHGAVRQLDEPEPRQRAGLDRRGGAAERPAAVAGDRLP